METRAKIVYEYLMQYTEDRYRGVTKGANQWSSYPQAESPKEVDEGK